MASIRNAQTWSEIEEMEPLAVGSGAEYERAWMWLEKLQSGGLRQIDIIRLGPLLEAVYRLGMEKGAQDANEQS